MPLHVTFNAEDTVPRPRVLPAPPLPSFPEEIAALQEQVDSLRRWTRASIVVAVFCLVLVLCGCSYVL